jgi:biotin synthase
MNLQEVLNREDLSREEIIFLLSLSYEEEIKELFRHADIVRSKYCGDEVHLSGIIDFSNNCTQNCLYCGLRADNSQLTRYRMTAEEIIETARQVINHGIYSIVLQSGEDPFFDTDMVAYVIYSIKQKSNAAITLSLGERGFDEYRTWKIAGADRYLLKHETANPKLYATYHIKQNLNDRLAHLKYLKRIGYEIGSGNLIGIPMQTVEDIADDILLCKELNADIASFSPFLPSSSTPYKNMKSGDLTLALKTIAVARIVLKKTYLPSTTALSILNENGRMKGLSVGGNVVMPDFTPNPYREHYLIYSTCKGISGNSENYRTNLENQIAAIGRTISSSRGDILKQNQYQNNQFAVRN